MLVVFAGLTIVFYRESYYTLLWLPLLALWQVNQVMLAVLAALIVMRALMRGRNKRHEALWIAGAALAMIGVLLGAFVLNRLIGLGPMLLPFVASMALPFWLYNQTITKWEQIGREYFKFE